MAPETSKTITIRMVLGIKTDRGQAEILNSTASSALKPPFITKRTAPLVMFNQSVSLAMTLFLSVKK